MAKKKQGNSQVLQDAVIYARYSSHNQKEESIEQQVLECTEFAKTNGLNVVEIYADSAVSGKTDRRTSFQRLLRDAEKGKFQVVIAYKSNRIARNMLNALQYENRLDGYGIRTLYAKEEFGDTAAGRFALRTMMNVNQFYSENMAEDIMRGLLDNAAEGKTNGQLTFGYVRGKDGRYEIQEQEAQVVREIYDRVLGGETFVDIANDLNSRGLRTKRGNYWNKGSFHRMLSNDAYIGVYRYADIVKYDCVPPIISKEVFDSMQNFLGNKKNPQGRHRENGEYILTGKLYCGYCKSHMVGISGRGKHGDMHYYYVCQKRRTDHDCKKKNVTRDWLEKRIAEITKAAILQDDVIVWIAENAVSFQQQARRSSKVGLLEQELSDNKTSQRNIMNAIEAGILTATTKDRLLEVEANISKIERALALEKTKDVPIEKDRIIYSLEQLKNGSVDDRAYRKKLIDSFVKSVYLYDDHIEIEYYYTRKKSVLAYSLENSGETAADVEAKRGSYKLPLAPPMKNPPLRGGFFISGTKQREIEPI